MDAASCLAAYTKLKKAFTFSAKRGLVEGSWDGVPLKCSVQASGGYARSKKDMSPHFNKK